LLYIGYGRNQDLGKITIKDVIQFLERASTETPIFNNPIAPTDL
jgi:hypothetical protein